MQTVEMRQAMGSLMQFSDKERVYDAYQARQNYLRMEGAINRRQRELEAALAQERAAQDATVRELDEEQLAKEAERLAKEAALAEITRLQALLRGNHPSGRI